MHGASSQCWQMLCMYVTLTLGTWPRTLSLILFQNCPVSGCGLAMGDQSLPTCSSLQATWQL